MKMSKDQGNVYRTGGVGSPSAGTVGGGRAGPTGSSSNNRGVEKVDPRASSLEMATGEEECGASSSRRSKRLWKKLWKGYDEDKLSITEFREAYRLFHSSSGREATKVLYRLKKRLVELDLDFADYERIRIYFQEKEEEDIRKTKKDKAVGKEKTVVKGEKIVSEGEEEETEDIVVDEERTEEETEDMVVDEERTVSEEEEEETEDIVVDEERTSMDEEGIVEKDKEGSPGMDTESSGDTIDREVMIRMKERDLVGKMDYQKEEDLTREGCTQRLSQLDRMLSGVLQMVTDLESEFSDEVSNPIEYACMRIRLELEEMLVVHTAIQKYHLTGKQNTNFYSVDTQTEDCDMCTVGIQTLDGVVTSSIGVQTQELKRKNISSVVDSSAGKVKVNKKVSDNLPIFGSGLGSGVFGPGVSSSYAEKVKKVNKKVLDNLPIFGSGLGSGVFGPGVSGSVLGPGVFGSGILGYGVPVNERKRELVQEEWKEIQRKSKKSARNVETVKKVPVVAVVPPKIKSRPRWSVPRSDAILVKSNNVEEARLVRSLIDAEAGKNIKRIKLNRSSQIIIELVENYDANEFKAYLRRVLPSNFEVRVLTKSFDLEIKDLDPLVDSPTILRELAEQLKIPSEDLDMKVLRSTNIGTQIAVVNTPTKWLQKILLTEKVRIGFCYVKLSPSPRLLRCYRCQELGHTSQRCIVKLAGDMRCRRCGVEGHAQATCTDSFACLDCMRSNLSATHLMGSMACPIFRRRVFDSKAHLVEFLKEEEKKVKSSTEVRNSYLRPGKHKKVNTNGSDSAEMSL